MAEYAALIGFWLDGEYEQVVLSTVDDTTINSSAEIATHPLVNGDVVADHMIKQPISLSLAGMIDNKEAKAILIKDQSMTLGNIQDTFERIQKEGILCDVTKIKVNEKSEGTPVSFLTRQQMALNHVTWTEGINSMTFSFNFTQVLLTDVLDYNIDPLDENLPDITMPEASNFATELFDAEAAASYFNQICLNDRDLTTPDFVDMLVSYAKWAAVSTGVAVLAGIALAFGVAASAVGIVAIGAVVIAGIYFLVDWIIHTSTYKIDKFKKYASDKKNKKELQRYNDLIESLLEQLKVLDNQILPFRIQTNQPQEALVSIGNQYYDFVFERNNTTNKWSMKLIDMSNKVLAEMSNVQAAPTTIMQGNIKYLYKTNDNYYLYIVKSQESSDDLDDLTNYCIVASLTDLSNFTEEMNKILKNYIMR